MKLIKAIKTIREIEKPINDKEKELYAQAIFTIISAIREGYDVAPLSIWGNDLAEVGIKSLRENDNEEDEKYKKFRGNIVANLKLISFILLEMSAYEVEDLNF